MSESVLTDLAKDYDYLENHLILYFLIIKELDPYLWAEEVIACKYFRRAYEIAKTLGILNDLEMDSISWDLLWKLH